MKKTILASILILTLAAAFGLYATNNASAHNNGNGDQIKFMKEMRQSMKEMFKEFKEARKEIFPKESKMITGKVISVATSSLKIDVRGAEYTVTVDSDGVIVNKVWDKINLNDIQVADLLKIVGNITNEQIEARLIQDLSLPPIKERMLTGKVASTTANSLTLKVGDKEYAVNVDSNDVVVNRIWNKINLSDIKAGDKAMVFGTVTNTTVEAKMVRDLSLPRLPVALENDEGDENEED